MSVVSTGRHCSYLCKHRQVLHEKPGFSSSLITLRVCRNRNGLIFTCGSGNTDSEHATPLVPLLRAHSFMENRHPPTMHSGLFCSPSAALVGFVLPRSMEPHHRWLQKYCQRIAEERKTPERMCTGVTGEPGAESVEQSPPCSKGDIPWMP